MENPDDRILVCNMGYRELVEAVEHLNKAFELLVDINDKLIDGIIDFIDMTEKLTDVWNEINNCRVHTQDDIYLEGLLIPAMGYVNDARLMLESLVVWRLGMSRHGRISILSSIREAVAEGIGPGIVQLESCMAA